MANVIFGLLLLIMLLVSLRAIRKPHLVQYIDTTVYRDSPRRRWNVLPWLVGLVIVILVLRFLVTNS